MSHYDDNPYRYILENGLLNNVWPTLQLYGTIKTVELTNAYSCMNSMDTFQQQTNVYNPVNACMYYPRTVRCTSCVDIYKALFPYDPIQDWAQKKIEEIDKKYAWATEEHFAEVGNKVLRDAGIKKRFRLEDYCIGRWAMICETEEEAETFLEYLDAKGQTWRTGVRYTDHSNWFEGCPAIAYRFNIGTMCPVGCVKKEDALYFKDYDWSWMAEHPLRTSAPKPQTVTLKG